MERIQPKLALVFPGVGSQHTLMAQSFYEHSPAAKLIFEEASDVLRLDMKALCFDNDKAEQLNQIDMSQLALLTASIAIFKAFEQETGICTNYMIGHSLGEYSALCASGAMSFADALRIVQQRGAIIQETIKHIDGTMMWVINVETEAVEQICRESAAKGLDLYISAYDSPTQHSISGTREAVMQAVPLIEKLGGIVYPLKLSGPFHSPLMKSAADEMMSVLTRYSFNESCCEVIANCNGQPYTGKDIASVLAQQLISPVRWQESVKYVASCQVEHVIEIGPKDVLKFLVRKCVPELNPFSYNDFSLTEKLKAQYMIQEKEWLSVIERCLKIAVCSRNYNKNIEEYRKYAISPYHTIERIYEQLVDGRQSIEVSHVRQAIEMVVAVLETKKLPLQLIDAQFKNILKGKVLKLN